MEPTRFELTPTQKGMLASWLIETGQPAPTLAEAIAHALEELQEHEPHGDANGHHAAPTGRKPIWESLIETSLELPDDELDLLPTDGATQHDHYIYGTPKRPA